MPLFFSRFQEFSPLFRIMEDFERATSPVRPRSFQPRFDVKELKDSYELHGEIPGFESGDVNIEWRDGNTLSITGRTEKRSEQGTPPAVEASEAPKAVEEAKASTTETDGSEAEGFEVVDSDTNSTYHKPTVEDEAGEADASNALTTSSATTAAGETTASTITTTLQGQEVVTEPAKPAERYWISERSVGSFSRAFSFPARVDQDAVKASLKNGILSIVVPKAQRKEPTKISIN